MALSAVLDPRLGTTLAGRYRVDAVIGQGGQGAVYRAHDLERGADVAVKVLNREASQDPEARERLSREARAMNDLEHTHSAKVHGIVEAGDGAACLVMELLDGMTLEEYLELIERHGKLLSLDFARLIFAPVVDTLEAAHDLGILHRDVKPSNVFVLKDSSVRLIDFGLAKFAELHGLTAQGFMAGSPSFVSPESWMGYPEGADRRLDVYSLGAVMFRSLCRRPPFVCKSQYDLAMAVTTAERPRVSDHRPDLPAALDGWAVKALAIHRDERHPTARALWDHFLEATARA